MSIVSDISEKLAYEEVLALLDSEIAKAKERGDLQTAETIEVLRAKVKAKFLGSVA